MPAWSARDITVLLPQGGGGGPTQYPLELSLTLTSSTTLPRSSGWVRSLTLTQTVTLVRSTGWVRSLTLTQTPTITRSVGWVRALTLTTTSTLARSVGWVRALTLTQTPAIERAVGWVREITLTATPTITRAVEWARALTVGLTVESIRSFTIGLVLDVTVALTATLTRSADWVRALTVEATPEIVRSVGWVREAVVGLTTDLAADFIRAIRHLRFTLRDKLNALVTERAVRMAVYTYAAGDPTDPDWMTLEQKALPSTDVDGLLDLIYDGDSNAGETVYIGLIIDDDPAQTMLWAEELVL
jgi:hypothetical protein